MFKKLFLPPALLLLIAISLVFIIAWAKEPGKKNTNAEKHQQTITYSLLSNPKTIDPAMNMDPQAETVLVNAFEGLMTISKSQGISAGVAEQWEISKDGLEYTFRLRRNAKWSDGKSVKASDFEYAWKRALSSELASENAHKLYPIKNAEKYHKGIVDEDMVGVKALGEFTLKVILERRTEYFLFLTSLPVYFPLRKDIVESAKGWELKANSYVVNGPFRMREWVTNELMVFEKNEYYWDADRVNLEVIEYEILAQRDDYLSSFQSGNTDIVYLLPQDRDFEVAKDTLGEIRHHASILFFSINLSGEASSLDFEAAKALRDIKVRQALSIAIDRDKLSQEIADGRLIAAFSFVPPGSLDNKGRSFAQRKFYDTSADVSKAKELLEEAGFPEAQGFPKLSIMYSSSSKEKALFKAIVDMWRENLNIEVNLIEEKREVFEERMQAQNYLISAIDEDSENLSPEAYLSMLITNSPENKGSYSSNAYDKVMEKALEEGDNFQRFKYYKVAEEILMVDMPVIPLFYRGSLLYVNEKIKDVIDYPLGYIYLKEAYVNQE